jgi:hypothetical protein
VEENRQIQINQSQQLILDEEKSQIQLKNISNNTKQLVLNDKKHFNNNHTLSITNRNNNYTNNEKIEEIQKNEKITNIKSENKDINHPRMENIEKSKYITAACAKNDFNQSSVNKNNDIINILYSNSAQCSTPISESLHDNQSKTPSNFCLVNDGKVNEELIIKDNPLLNKVKNF